MLQGLNGYRFKWSPTGWQHYSVPQSQKEINNTSILLDDAVTSAVMNTVLNEFHYLSPVISPLPVVVSARGSGKNTVFQTALCPADILTSSQ